MDRKLLFTTLRNVALAGVYIFGISQFLYYGGKIFEGIDNSLAPFVMLLLFSLSAAVVGSLVFGQAVLLSLEGKRLESVRSAIYSVMWLFLITLIVIAILLVIK